MREPRAGRIRRSGDGATVPSRRYAARSGPTTSQDTPIASGRTGRPIRPPGSSDTTVGTYVRKWRASALGSASEPSKWLAPRFGRRPSASACACAFGSAAQRTQVGSSVIASPPRSVAARRSPAPLALSAGREKAGLTALQERQSRRCGLALHGFGAPPRRLAGRPHRLVR